MGFLRRTIVTEQCFSIYKRVCVDYIEDSVGFEIFYERIC